MGTAETFVLRFKTYRFLGVYIYIHIQRDSTSVGKCVENGSAGYSGV